MYYKDLLWIILTLTLVVRIVKGTHADKLRSLTIDSLSQINNESSVWAVTKN